MTANTKYKGSVLMAAIGDALGWITEFEKSPESIASKYGVDKISYFHDWQKNVGGRFNGYVDKIKAGSYSDDTQLMLSVARSIKPDGSIDNEYFSKVELPTWLLYSRGAGRTIKNAARKIQRKSAKWNNNFFTYKAGSITLDYKDSGANGAAMRILPIALANLGDLDKIKEEIFSNSIITHGHPRAIIGAMLYGFAVDTIIRFTPENINYKNFLTELGSDICSKLSLSFLEKPEYISWEKEWNKRSELPFREIYNEVLLEVQDSLRNAYIFINNNESDFNALSGFGCYRNETKGSGISTVIAGIYLCCKYISNPVLGIEQAVNAIGTDTDSIAAFAGGLLGGLHGDKLIPKKWKKVQDYNYLIDIAYRLLAISEDRYTESSVDILCLQKSLNKIELDNYVEKEEVSFTPLGSGIVTIVDRQDTLTRGKYNVILSVIFRNGQSCVFSKLLNKDIQNINAVEKKPKKEEYDYLDTINFREITKTSIGKFLSKLSDVDKEEFLSILVLIEKDVMH